jgi:hypothetical protein
MKFYQRIITLLERQGMQFGVVVAEKQKSIAQRDKDIGELSLITRDAKFSCISAKSEFVRTKVQLEQTASVRASVLEQNELLTMYGDSLHHRDRVPPSWLAEREVPGEPPLAIQLTADRMGLWDLQVAGAIVRHLYGHKSEDPGEGPEGGAPSGYQDQFAVHLRAAERAYCPGGDARNVEAPPLEDPEPPPAPEPPGAAEPGVNPVRPVDGGDVADIHGELEAAMAQPELPHDEHVEAETTRMPGDGRGAPPAAQGVVNTSPPPVSRGRWRPPPPDSGPVPSGRLPEPIAATRQGGRFNAGGQNCSFNANVTVMSAIPSLVNAVRDAPETDALTVALRRLFEDPRACAVTLRPSLRVAQTGFEDPAVIALDIFRGRGPCLSWQEQTGFQDHACREGSRNRYYVLWKATDEPNLEVRLAYCRDLKDVLVVARMDAHDGQRLAIPAMFASNGRNYTLAGFVVRQDKHSLAFVRSGDVWAMHNDTMISLYPDSVIQDIFAGERYPAIHVVVLYYTSGQPRMPTPVRPERVGGPPRGVLRLRFDPRSIGRCANSGTDCYTNATLQMLFGSKVTRDTVLAGDAQNPNAVELQKRFNGLHAGRQVATRPLVELCHNVGAPPRVRSDSWRRS